MSTTKTVAVRMNASLYEALAYSAKKRHLSISTLLRTIAAEKLENELVITADQHLRSSKANEQELTKKSGKY